MLVFRTFSALFLNSS